MESTAVIDSMRRALFGLGVNNGNRIDLLCEMLFWQPPEIFWPVFQHAWSSCEGTWRWSREIQRMLRQRAGSAREFMEEEDGAFYDGLPELIVVYRGCHPNAVRSVSWTTDFKIAQFFAGRGLGRRVIASSVVPQEAVFTVSTDRKESELLVDPRRLRKLNVSDYVCEARAVS